MGKKIIVGIIVGLVLFGLLVMIKSSKNNKTEEPITPITDIKEETTPTPQFSFKMKEYSDSSGFKFSYPEELTVAPNSIVDENIFSDLKISSKKMAGSITIKVLLTKLKSIDDWLKENKIYANNAVIKDTKLADVKAKYIKKDSKLYTVGIDQYQTLFVIEADIKENEKFWNDANEAVSSSFAFFSPASSGQDNGSSGGAASDGGGDDVIFEGEEEVE